jgi:hypothetical protein
MKINRNLFTDRQRETFKDYALAIVLGIALAVGALAYFDVLVK